MGEISAPSLFPGHNVLFFQIMNVKPQSITRKKDTRRAVALDSENNNVATKDIVKVIDGPHSVKFLGHIVCIIDLPNCS